MARQRSGVVRTEAGLLRGLLEAQGAILGAGSDPELVMTAIVERARKLTRSSGAVLEVPDGDEMVYGTASGTLAAATGVRVPAAGSLSGLCARTDNVLRCDDSENDPRVDRPTCRQVGLRSMIVAPLPFDGRVITVLKVVSPQAEAYRTRDVAALEQLNLIMGMALGQARRHAEVAAARAAARHVSDTEARLRVEATLASSAYHIVYQPVVRLADSCTVGYEALARFERGVESPDWWFGAAATVGLGARLELALAQSALDGLSRLRDGGYLAINVSPTTLLAPQLRDLVLSRAPQRTVIEITEHTRVDDYRALGEICADLRAHGVRIAVDDAGAGFSSLRHVLQLQPDLIKLDSTITADIQRKRIHRTLVTAMQTFAHGTASALVAEGVETHETAHVLGELGVAYGQGYLWGRPAALPVVVRDGEAGYPASCRQ
jgi:EAL domain-containing protein (putative c-di-GMP-specific phosphodiesterase class I)